jgi:cytochrome c553
MTSDLRAAGRALLNARLAMAKGTGRYADEAHAWDRFALALDAAEDAALLAGPAAECVSCHDGRNLPRGWECTSCGRVGDVERDADPAPAADGGEVEALAEQVTRAAAYALYEYPMGSPELADATRRLRGQIAKALRENLADLRRTERAEGARAALLAAAEDRSVALGEFRQWLRARAATEPTTDSPGDGVEVREVGGRG